MKFKAEHPSERLQRPAEKQSATKKYGTKKMSEKTCALGVAMKALYQGFVWASGGDTEGES